MVRRLGGALMLTDAGWLVGLGPLMGFFLLWMQKQTWIKGLWLLASAIGAAMMIVGAYGLSVGWHPTEWRQAPMAVLMLVAVSNLTSQTTKAVVDAVHPPGSQD